MKHDDFYIGYHDKTPGPLAARMRKGVAGLIVGSVLLAVALVFSQETFDPGTFEFLQYREFEGTVFEQPYPTLRVTRPGVPGLQPSHSRYYLVQQGKFGAQERTEGLDGRHVRLSGALIYRDDQTMIELGPDGFEPVPASGPTASAGPGRSLGMVTLQGEIVDSKCFLGVMKPGNLNTHRACATRCISGGIPPVLAVRQVSSETTYLLLVSTDGRTVNQDVLDMIAEPVEITGRVVQYDNMMVLHADPSTYRRLNP